MGNVPCSVDVPFFHVTQPISPQGKQDFLSFIAQSDHVFKGLPPEEKSENAQEKCRRFLSRCVMCVNPEMAVQYGDQYLAAIDVPGVRENEDFHLALLLHIGLMPERNICRKKVLFDNQEAFSAQHAKLFQLLRAKAYLLESVFEIELNDAELCFLIQAITQYNQKSGSTNGRANRSDQ